MENYIQTQNLASELNPASGSSIDGRPGIKNPQQIRDNPILMRMVPYIDAKMIGEYEGKFRTAVTNVIEH